MAGCAHQLPPETTHVYVRPMQVDLIVNIYSVHRDVKMAATVFLMGLYRRVSVPRDSTGKPALIRTKVTRTAPSQTQLSAQTCTVVMAVQLTVNALKTKSVVQTVAV